MWARKMATEPPKPKELSPAEVGGMLRARARSNADRRPRIQ